MYTDKTLVCKDCGNEFVFTAGEQEFYAEKGFQNGRLAAVSDSDREGWKCAVLQRKADRKLCGSAKRV